MMHLQARRKDAEQLASRCRKLQTEGKPDDTLQQRLQVLEDEHHATGRSAEMEQRRLEVTPPHASLCMCAQPILLHMTVITAPSAE